MGLLPDIVKSCGGPLLCGCLVQCGEKWVPMEWYDATLVPVPERLSVYRKAVYKSNL